MQLQWKTFVEECKGHVEQTEHMEQTKTISSKLGLFQALYDIAALSQWNVLHVQVQVYNL